MNDLILVINPGSTSTKLAIYKDGEEDLSKTLRHSPQELEDFSKITDQNVFRKGIIVQFLKEAGYSISDFSAVIGRGGLTSPIPGGIYKVDEKMLSDLRTALYGEHASNLGAILASELVADYDIPAFIADPVVVDEMSDLARYSGHPLIKRKSIFHALNQKAVARIAAEELGREYDQCNMIVVHMGGGISIGAHEKGRVVDVNNALDGEGPFTPERSGTLPLTQLIDMCYCEQMTFADMKKKLKGKGGMVSYLGTNDAMEVQKMIDNGDEKAYSVYKALSYQVSKDIGRAAAVLKGKVDCIILTGGLAYDSKRTVKWISEMVSFIAPIKVYPGGDEEKALAFAARRVLNGDEEAKVYSGYNK